MLQMPMNEYATLLLSEYSRSMSSHSRQVMRSDDFPFIAFNIIIAHSVTLSRSVENCRL